MDEKFSTELSEHIVFSNKKFNLLIGEMKKNYPKEEYQSYLDKLAHMMALSFDVLDLIGKDYPHLNPYDNDEEY